MPDPLPSYAPDPRPPHARSPALDGFDNTPPTNPITDEGAFLGRVLFYDRLLSANGEVACASCHRQDRAFTDPARLSIGFEGESTRRHSMSLVNLRFYAPGRMFWDERAETLEDQVLEPIQDAVEMGVTLEELVERVTRAPYYPRLFTAAFGSSGVTTERISLALAQFVRSLSSFDSRWDEGVAQVQSLTDDFPNYSASENRGKALFLGQGRPDLGGSCAACHLRSVAPPAPGTPRNIDANQAYFFMSRPRNNGLSERADDDGFAEVTGDPADDNAFKSSSLRNVAETAPYMHDGRFATLEDVLRFYDRGIEAQPNLDPILRTPGAGVLRFRFDPGERADMIAFLRTLSGRALLVDPRFASPFPEL
ncbi:MAG: cytochrome c peroxidase [Myxococcota bacterium]